jgi:hypothetical protein
LIVDALARLRSRSCIIDGEAVACDDNGIASFDLIRHYGHHTNTIEGFWSIFKRGIVGSFHKVSAKYMPLYVAEFQFRYNNRENTDIFGTAIAGC